MQDSITEFEQLIVYYLWYFAYVAAYLLKKEVEKNKTPSLI